MIDSISATRAPSIQDANVPGRELDRDAFLKLLLTQLNHQDPMAPTANEEFVAQLAQFSSLEQMQSINRNLQDSINTNLLLNQSMNNSLVTTLIGKDVIATTNKITLGASGEAELGYRLEGPADKVTVNIYDPSGALVATLSDTGMAAGEHAATWNGRGKDGNRLPAGAYTFEVVPYAKSGDELPSATPFVRGRITGVRYHDGRAVLLIGSAELDLSDVESIIGANVKG